MIIIRPRLLLKISRSRQQGQQLCIFRMAADHFCLRWNNYQSNMVTELDTLRSEEHLVDVTLSCEGQKFRAHKVILSACSVYFRNVFKENPCEHPVVILKDVSHEDVEALLSFVYQGVVYVSEKKLASFLQTAELLQIKGLTGAASSIKENHNTEKGGPPPLNPTWPTNKSSSKTSSCSPTPPKRKKGTPVRICKTSDGGGGGGGDNSDTNSNNAAADEEGEISVKQEKMDDGETLSVQVSLGADDDTSHDGSSMMMAMYQEGGGGGDSNSASGYGGGGAEEEEEEDEDDGEVKGGRGEGEGAGDTAATLLERSLSGASVSRPQFDMQGPFSAFPIPAPGQGLPEQLTPSGMGGDGRSMQRGEWRCMQPQRCQLCGKVFSNSGNLRQHVSNVHTPGQHVTCTYCSRVFKNKEYLRKHHVQTHNVPLRRHRGNTMPSKPTATAYSLLNLMSQSLQVNRSQ
ncbi:hypothetical protein LSTR_LSTR006064 [Laodelphax striatellus]|uniref:BTB domain-containing protein n=1 Tax=Laodelphax striatellus TaxID=195883 RepID=A0A482XQQ2_LAOST|nr:hypothetical protein LSTR_LSTR006064 [Laodelphax striatellus]